MSFDLYATTAIAKTLSLGPTITTLDALAVAEWIQLVDGNWQLQWRDHTDYGAEGGIDDNTGTFTCTLRVKGWNKWVYDCWHSHRGGERDDIDLRCPGAFVEDAKQELRTVMERMVKDWTESVEDQRRLEGEGSDE
jgi:hypothetical protein